uniref:carbon storage regulator n=1 Tax=Pseudomonas tohonis TaxID=2725477 RepID=UPI001F24CC10|nr:carbon storage regulator [Pseudomonas tohonis]
MDGVSVRVLGLHGRQVRIGVTAPKSTSIHREEVQARVRAGLPRMAKRGAAA